MKKYIFLDIDGVLACSNHVVDSMWAISDEKQRLLAKILDATGADIVLSSSWRKHTIEETKEYMAEKGFWFVDKIVGVTIRSYHYIERGVHLSIPRGVEIRQWIDTNVLSDNGKNFDRNYDFRYVILDDDSDMLLEQNDVFVNTYWEEGLTEYDVEKAINILNK